MHTTNSAKQKKIKIKILDKYKDAEVQCELCDVKRKGTLDMFTIKMGKQFNITLCDNCLDLLLNKVLTASVYTQTRLKEKDEIKLSNRKFAMNFENKKSEDKRLEWEEIYKELGEEDDPVE